MKQTMQTLEQLVCNELAKGTDKVCTKELGDVIDMIKDCAQTMYYYKIYESMQAAQDGEVNGVYPEEVIETLASRSVPHSYYYYGGVHEKMAHPAESDTETARQEYITVKQQHKETTPQAQELKAKHLDKYIKELTGDITQMMANATAEEKAALKQKLATIQTKI